MKRIFTVLALAAVAFAGCSKVDDGQVAGDGKMWIMLDPTIANPAITPSAMTRATDTDFEQADEVGLTIMVSGGGAPFVDNMKLSYDAVKAVFATQQPWYEDVNARSSLLAYYPYQAGDKAPAEFMVQADQSDKGLTQSDLIVAVKADVKPTLAATAMTFKHKMTRIIVDVTNESGSDVKSIKIKGAIGTGTLDAATGAFTAKADAAKVDVTTHVATKNKVYYALLVPQNGVVLEVTTETNDGKVRTYTLGTTDLKSGENRRMNLNVQPADAKVSLSGPITSWIDGEELFPGGEGTVEDAVVEWGGVKYKIVTMKDGRDWFAENLRYVPAGVAVSTDPTDNNAKIWAPYTSDGTICTAVTDADEVAKVGYLYSFATALGATDIDIDNAASFDGVRGICPDGWHIPTNMEWIKLVGKSNKDAGGNDISDQTAAYYDSTLDGGNVVTMDADGFKFTTSGVRMRSTLSATGAYQKNVFGDELSITYYMCSTFYKATYSSTDATQLTNIQFFSPTTLFNAKGKKLSLGYLGFKSGVAVRCIKDLQNK